jgi:hypothetical protein
MEDRAFTLYPQFSILHPPNSWIGLTEWLLDVSIPQGFMIEGDLLQ